MRAEDLGRVLDEAARVPELTHEMDDEQCGNADRGEEEQNHAGRGPRGVALDEQRDRPGKRRGAEQDGAPEGEEAAQAPVRPRGRRGAAFDRGGGRRRTGLRLVDPAKSGHSSPYVRTG
jgi:hypothetical protein